MMPMAPEIGRLDRHRDHVAHGGGNVAVAPRTDVQLGCLIRLDPANLAVRAGGEVGHGVQPSTAHTTKAVQTISAAATKR